MEYMTVPFDLDEKSVHDDEEDKASPFFNLSGYASTFKNTDLVNDVIEPGAFSNSLSAKNGKKIKILWQHNTDQPIGKVVKVFEDDKGLFIKAVLPKDHSLAHDAAVLVKNGIIDSMSIGFTVNDSDITKSGKRILKDIKVHEISLVTHPANPKAQVTSFKRIDDFIELPLAPRDTPWSHQKSLERIEEFYYYQKDNNYNQKAYLALIEELPCDASLIADVIDAEVYAIPKAIFSLSASIKSNNVDPNLTGKEIAQVKDSISRYYAKMDLANPFTTNKFNSQELESLTKRELEHVLRESGLCLSKSAATYFISQLNWNRSESDAGLKQRDIDCVTQSIMKLTSEMKTNGY